MNRNGVVTDIKGDRAVVQILKHTACGDCGACHLGDDNKHIKIECANEPGAQVGEFVEVDLETPNVLGAAFIMYMVPLAALLVGVVAGSWIYGLLVGEAYKELVGAGIGVVLMASTFLFIKSKEEKFSDSQKYLSRITKVDRKQLQSSCKDSTIEE